jgi:hypothetical protein
MARRKNDINFIESQKLVAKQNQSTSFEFILVISVIVLVVAMGTIYGMNYMTMYGLDGKSGYAGDIANGEKNLATAKQIEATDSKNFNHFELYYDDNGNLQYRYSPTSTVSAAAVANEYAGKVADARDATSAVSSQVDLTSAVINIIFAEAAANDCKVTSFTFSAKHVTLTLNSPTQFEWGYYKNALTASENTASGYDNSKYLKNVVSTATTQGADGRYTFKIDFDVISDTVYLVGD